MYNPEGFIKAAVHPRRCGEHLFPHCIVDCDFGSSPQVRGTQSPPSARMRLSRFIPAGAGNTRALRGISNSRTVHPRRCGEHLVQRSPLPAKNGSSPQVRGTLQLSSLCAVTFRFIPAGAGNTTHPRCNSRGDAVHPRRCGEHTQVQPGDISGCGSSPQVRGTLHEDAEEDLESRFIPAGAGNTPQVEGTLSPESVHPRRCGEHPLPSTPPAMPVGSSPQVRGTPSYPR